MSAETAMIHMTEIPVRSETRQRVVHLVEYSRYPRRDPSEERRVAYTQDFSNSGIGLDLAETIEPGELLRITLRDIDGAIDMDGLARVVWCRANDSGRARAGVEMLREGSEKRMIRVRDSSADRSTRAALHPPQ